MWDTILGLIAEIKKCEEAGATISAVSMAYICIDTMTFLSLPEGQDRQRGADFISWVDTYLVGDREQLYQYRGLDVYGARCAVLHNFGSDANFHQQNPDAKRYGYHDGGKHAYNPAVDEHLVIIGTTSFLNDVVIAVEKFLDECRKNVDLRQLVEARLPKVLETLPFPS